jgi:hypothetical protein
MASIPRLGQQPQVDLVQNQNHQDLNNDVDTTELIVDNVARSAIKAVNSDDQQGLLVSGPGTRFALNLLEKYIKKPEDENDGKAPEVTDRIYTQEENKKRIEAKLSRIMGESGRCFTVYFSDKIYPYDVNYKANKKNIDSFIKLMEDTENLISNENYLTNNLNTLTNYLEAFKKYAGSFEAATRPKMPRIVDCFLKNVPSPESYECKGENSEDGSRVNSEVENSISNHEMLNIESLKKIYDQVGDLNLPRNFHLPLSRDMVQSIFNPSEVNEERNKLNKLKESLQKIETSLNESNWENAPKVTISGKIIILKEGILSMVGLTKKVDITMNYTKVKKLIDYLKMHLTKMEAYYIAIQELANPPDILKEKLQFYVRV